MDSHKFAFITCVNDEELYSRCWEYIEALEVPAGFSIEVRKIVGATGIPSAYNQAMQETDAKYKVYLHQDTFIYNRRLLIDVLNLFNTYPRLGMLGVVGGTRLPRSGIWFEDGLHSFGKVWENRRGGGFYYLLGPWNRRKRHLMRFLPVRPPFKPVLVIDGLLMITQYDLPWREDLYDNFLYYEGPQCLEFIKHGYLVAVPYQKEPWCMHWGPQRERTAEEQRRLSAGTHASGKIFVQAYPEFIGVNVQQVLPLYEDSFG